MGFKVNMRMRIKMAEQRGASAIEFAMIFPLLVIIVFGIIECSILFYDKAMLTNASREGARLGIVYRYNSSGPNHPDDGEIGVVVNQYAQSHLINFDATSVITTTIQRTGDSSGDALTVSVSYPYSFLVFSNLLSLFGAAAPNLITLNAVTIMRME